MASYRVISSDNHVFEYGDLGTSSVEPKFRDRVPKTRRTEDGSDWWFCDGLKICPVAVATQPGRRFEEPEKLTYRDTVDNIYPGGYVPDEQVKDMDADGVEAGILYPTLGLLLYSVPDSELLTVIFAHYNDWLAKFCGAFPKRLKGIAMINIDDVQSGIREMERTAKMGLIGAMITVYPTEDRSYDSPEYEPLWAAAQDMEIPISLHVGTNRPGPGQQFANILSLKPGFFANVDYWVRVSAAHMIYSGVFERYPKLQVGIIEHELSWVPYYLNRLDYNYTQRTPGDVGWYRYKEDMLPSDYFHRNVFLSFQEEALGIRDRHIIGVDSLLWGSDYPHVESTFPRSQQILEEILADCTEEEKAKIAGGNTARVYRLD